MNRTLDRPGDRVWTAEPDTPDAGAHLAERQLLDALERALRSGARGGWVLLLLHLSRLPHPGPRPYHRRLSAALLDEAAERCTGQLFGLGNGDLALLFRPPDDGAAASALLAGLFEAEMQDTAALRSLFPLPDGREPAMEDLRGRMRVPPPRVQTDEDWPEDASRAERPIRQTAIQLRPGSAERLVPLFHELVMPPSRRMERDMLDAVPRALGLDGAGTGTGLATPLHLNLTPAGVLSEPFARLARRCGTGTGIGLGIELPLAEAVADPATFLLARERLRLAGMRFILDGVTHGVLRMTRPGFLDPEWLKLGWDPAMPEAGLNDAIGRLGPDRIVLAGCDTEAAVVWGLKAGLQRFQGGFVDTMLAAERMRRCGAASGCSLVQCRSRAGAIEPGGRAGCRNLPLLEASAPAFTPIFTKGAS